MKRRPWRLTRRERVEMEAALGRLRRWSGHPSFVTSAADLFGRLAGAEMHVVQSGGGYGGRTWRIWRARVAIALRAALRADEDARCDEARARVDRSYDGADYERSEMRGAAEDWCDSLREWPALRSVAYEWPDGVPVPPSVLTVDVPGVGTYVLPSRVPRALWDR